MKRKLFYKEFKLGRYDVKFEFGISTYKDPTKQFSFAGWYIDLYCYYFDGDSCKKRCVSYRVYDFKFRKIYALLIKADERLFFDGKLLEIFYDEMTYNKELHKKVFEAEVKNGIDLDGFDGGIDFVKWENIDEDNYILRIYDEADNNRKFIAKFDYDAVDEVVCIYAHEDNDSLFNYADYNHLAQLPYKDKCFNPDNGACDNFCNLMNPRPIKVGENLIGIKFDLDFYSTVED